MGKGIMEQKASFLSRAVVMVDLVCDATPASGMMR